MIRSRLIWNNTITDGRKPFQVFHGTLLKINTDRLHPSQSPIVNALTLHKRYCFVSTRRYGDVGVGDILLSTYKCTHTHFNTHRNQEPVLHWQGPTSPCARWSHLPLPWWHQPKGKALLRVRMRPRVYVCARLWLWQNLELKEAREKLEEGLQEFMSGLACLRFMSHFLLPFTGRGGGTNRVHSSKRYI